MDKKWSLVEQARDLGFEAAEIETASLVMNPEFRKYCGENRCGQYDANYSCPPACGTVEEMRAALMAYGRALVVHTTWDIEGYHDHDAIRQAKRRHNEAMLTLCDALRQEGHACRMGGASQCILCESCAMKQGEPCREPERRYSCLSAYCIDVAKLAAEAGLEFCWTEKQLHLYGLIAY